ALVRGQVGLRRSPLYLPLGGYALAMGISALASAEPRTSALKLCGELYLLGLAVLTLNVVTDAARLRRVVRVWLGATALSVLACAVGVALFYAGLRDAAEN